MFWLMAGLVLFLGAHSLRFVAGSWREATLARIGPKRWRGLISVVSIVGFGLIIWGYGQARANPVILWTAPEWMRFVTAALTLAAFVLMAAGVVGANHIQHRLGHSLVAGVKLWAVAHLLAHGWWPGVLVFGTFLVWAILSFTQARKRDRAAGVAYAAPQGPRTAMAVLGGAAAWFLFTFWLHGWWIGVRPLG